MLVNEVTPPVSAVQVESLRKEALPAAPPQEKLLLS